MKYRGTGFSANEFPFVISSTGLEVLTFGETELNYGVSNERISSGVARLDSMLGGGYYRGSGVLLTGAPGTAKTTLAGTFSEAACLRGERVLYVALRRTRLWQIIRNLASVGIRLGPHAEAGLLDIYAVRTETESAESHLVRLRNRIRDRQPRCMVIDPISALGKSGGRVAAVDASFAAAGPRQVAGDHRALH